jgi:hypothetical protein
LSLFDEADFQKGDKIPAMHFNPDLWQYSSGSLADTVFVAYLLTGGGLLYRAATESRQ